MWAKKYSFAWIVLYYMNLVINTGEGTLLKYRHQRVRDRIVGGKEAEPHSAPYIAFLNISDSDISFRCGGTLISSNYILTAAHCLRGYLTGLEVILGAHNISENEDTQRRINLTGRFNFTIHGVRDIALIRLPNPVVQTDYIKAVVLPGKADVDKDYSNQFGIAYGWGFVKDKPRINADVLHSVEVSILPEESCNDFYGGICTSGIGSKGTCAGDSGGPLVVDGKQIGITSYGPRQCEGGWPSKYVFVNKFLNWIQDNTDVNIH